MRWLAMLVLIAGWAWLALPSGLGGPLSLVWVRGESMQPTYQGGDLAITYRTSSYEIGDVVAFDIPEGGIVIHRIVEESPEGFIPQGDNRAHADPWTLAADDIVGEALVRIPAGGKLLYILRQPFVLAVLAFLTVLVAAWPNKGKREGALLEG